MEHLDDTLWQAMYGNEGTSSVFDAVLLDAASSAFTVASIFVLFYLANMADGVNVTTAVKEGQGGAGGLSSGLGGAAGGSAASAGGKLAAGARKLTGKAKSGIRGGLRKLFKK